MSFIQSDHVKVFPSTYRTEYLQGKYTSEENFVNIINSITDIKNYVLDWKFPILKVVINGYYFEVSLSSNVLPANMWLGIKVEQGDVNSNALVNFDDSSTTLDMNGTFRGLSSEISAEQPSTPSLDNYKYYWLRVTDSKGSWEVNKARINAESVKYDVNGSIKDEVDSKQDALTPGNGITIDNNVISIDNSNYKKLTSLANKGSNNKHVYFNSNGEAVASTADAGAPFTTSSAYNSTRVMYIKGGESKNGIRIFSSVNTPGSGDGELGDIWIKYTA